MPKTFRLIALSLVGLAILLGILALGMGNNSAPATDGQANQAETAPVPQIVVAAKDLAPGKPIELGDLQTIDAPNGSSPGQLTSPLQAKGAIPTRPIAAGTPLRSDLFLRGLSSHLNTGERAIAVGVNEISSVGNHIEPGDYVDVYLNLDDRRNGSSPTENSPVSSRLLASRLRVLAIGRDSVAGNGATEPEPTPDNHAVSGNDVDERAAAINARASDQQGNSQPRPPAATAVLAIAPDDAALLLLAAQEGRLSLLLRNPADAGVVNRERFSNQNSPLVAGIAPLSADDRAYAGVNRRQLLTAPTVPSLVAASTPTQRRAVRRHGASTSTARSSGVQIIRGSEAPHMLSTH